MVKSTTLVVMREDRRDSSTGPNHHGAGSGPGPRPRRRTGGVVPPRQRARRGVPRASASGRGGTRPRVRRIQASARADRPPAIDNAEEGPALRGAVHYARRRSQ